MQGHYLSNDQIAAIILMSIAITWFLVSCGYAWRDKEAHLLLERQEDEIYNLRKQLHPSRQELPESLDVSDRACYQMLCGPVVTLINGELVYVKEDMAYPNVNVGERQFNAGCQDPLSCQAQARWELRCYL